MNRFLEYKVKDYRYWTIYIMEHQNYLGRCVVWCKRRDALDLTDTTPEERDELFIVLKDLKEALKKAFQLDWCNYAFLGNETRHLHCHLVPRYASQREFGGVTFEDKKWGHNYKTDPDFKVSEELLEQIKNKVKEAIA